MEPAFGKKAGKGGGNDVKTVAAELAYFVRRQALQNLRLLLVYCTFLVTMVAGFSFLFRYLMLHLEGREFSWIASLYWTITVMTTVGFGDITFRSDPGLMFATLVTVSGVVFLLIFLPFLLISLFVAPWLEQSLRYRPRTELPEDTRGHVLVFGLDAITRAFLRKLEGRNIPFVVVTADLDAAFRLEAEGLKVICGTATDAAFLDRTRLKAARHIVANLNDPTSVNLCLTARALGAESIAVIVDDPVHADLLRLAGATHAIPLSQILGRYLAARSTTRGAMCHVLGSFGRLLISEVPVYGTPLAGRILGQAVPRDPTSISVIGLLERGVFTAPRPESVLSQHTLMLLAGTREQLFAVDQLVRVREEEDMVFILGHGRIGCAAATTLDQMKVPYMLIDRRDNPACGTHAQVTGDATNLDLLRESGIGRASGMIITTNDDNINIFLTLAGRHVNPHVRIVARANGEENVDELYAAGADFVVSSASVGANILANVLDKKGSIFLTEGVGIFRRPLPQRLAGWTIAESGIEAQTGCTVVALKRPDTPEPLTAPPPDTVLEVGTEIVLIGSPEQEKRFNQAFQ
jgi:Trk K+ transport system NAD-binding subunit